MKKLTLEATDENVLNSIRENTLDRRKDIKDFIQALDMIEGNVFISLDARWGEGKTFYVRQVEKTLEYLVKKTWGEPEDIEDLEQYFESTGLENIKLNQSYLPIYYNAWLYDNHNDPLMSLLFVVAKKCKQYLDTKIDAGTVGEKIKGLLASISINNIPMPFNNNIPISVDGEKVKDAFAGKDILQKIKTSEEIREEVKRIFNDIIVEDAQKLVIFIDELDRCRPSFAIEMLERIKHYFDDGRIMFVVSVNKEQLVHTISNFYGNNFDSSGYLNKFFDIPLQLPPAETRYYLQSLGISCSVSYRMVKIAGELQNYYKLSLRDTIIYFQKINIIKDKWDRCSYGDSQKILSILVPVLCILDIVDVNAKRKILSGNGIDMLKQIVINSEAATKLIIDLLGETIVQATQKDFDALWNEFEKVYKFAFSDNNVTGWYSGKMDISADLKKQCLRICNLT